MKWLQDKKRKIGEYFLYKELSSSFRNRAFTNFTSSKNIGILFDATDLEEFELVKRYVGYLKAEGKKVKVIGYFNTSLLPEVNYSRREYDFYTKGDLNWYLKPLNDFAQTFIEEEYDILIDMNIRNVFSLHYIAALSKAKFKIGRYTEDTDLYDFMIEMDDSKGLKYYLRNIDHYLLKINTKHE